MPVSSLPLVNYLLDAATRRRTVSGGLPDSPTLKRVLSARGSLAPIDTAQVDPEMSTLNFRETQPLVPGLEQRPRQVSPPTELEKARQEVEWINGADNRGLGGSTLEKHGRAKSFLEGFLGAAGNAANRALEQGNVGWGGVAQALGSGAGGGTVYGIDPNRELKARHEQARAEAQKQLDQAIQNETNTQRIETIKSQNVARENAATARERQLDLKEQEIINRDDYYDRSVKLREDALNNKISFSEWTKQQAELDRQFKKERAAKGDELRERQLTINQQNAEANTTRANRPPAAGVGDASSAYARAEELQKQIDELNAQDKKEPSFNPVLDSKTGQPTTNAKGEIIYGNTRTAAYKERQARKKVLMAEKEKLFTEARKAEARGTKPQGQVFSISKWKAANPNGDAKAAAAKARSLGYTVTD